MRRWNFPADGLLLESDLSGILLFHNGNPTPRLSIFLKKEPSNLWWQHMPSNSKRLGQYSSTCSRLLNRLLSVWLLSSAFYSTYCPWAQGFLFYFRINLQPIARLGVGESFVCTHLGRFYLAVSRGFPPSSWLQHHIFPPALCDMVQGSGEGRTKHSSHCLSLQPALSLYFLSSTNASIHFPFTANGCHCSLLLSPFASFSIVVTIFDYFHFNEGFGREQKLKSCI